MASTPNIVYDPDILPLITSFLDDHFDLLSLSQASKFHRQFVLRSVQKITVRNLVKIDQLPHDVPNMTSLNINLCDKFSFESFRLLSHIFRSSFLTNFPLGRLRVLRIPGFPLKKEVAEEIGKSCQLLEDLTVEGSLNCPLSKEGWSNLMFGSKPGLRRLSINLESLNEDVFLLFFQCSSLTSLSVICENFIFLDRDKKNFEYIRVNLKNLRELRLKFGRGRENDYVTDYMTVLCDKIIDCGSPLEAFDCPHVKHEIIRKLFRQRTLCSFTCYPEEVMFVALHFISTNLNLMSLKIYESFNAISEAIMEKIALVEGIRKAQSNLEIGIVPYSFLQGRHLLDIEFNFGVQENLSSKTKFLQEFTLELPDSVGCEESYPGLKQLFTMCSLLKKVHVIVKHNIVDSYRVVGRPKLCSALESLSNCHNLEDLSAPVGDKSLRTILRGVKGLRRLKIDKPLEVFSDESALQLETSAPFLRRFELNARLHENCEPPIQKSGITQRGLDALSNNTQLQALEVGRFGMDGLCLKSVAEKCLWLNYLVLSITSFEDMKRNNREAIKVLMDRGCSVCLVSN